MIHKTSVNTGCHQYGCLGGYGCLEKEGEKEAYHCKPFCTFWSVGCVTILSIFKRICQPVVSLTSKCWRGWAKDKFCFLLSFAWGCSHSKQRRSVEKSGCQVAQKRMGEVTADLLTMWSASWPGQVTNNESTSSLLYCFLPRNLECHRWLCFDRNLVHTQNIQYSRIKVLTSSYSLSLVQAMFYVWCYWPTASSGNTLPDNSPRHLAE